MGAVRLQLENAIPSGKLVFEARNIRKERLPEVTALVNRGVTPLEAAAILCGSKSYAELALNGDGQ